MSQGTRRSRARCQSSIGHGPVEALESRTLLSHTATPAPVASPGTQRQTAVQLRASSVLGTGGSHVNLVATVRTAKGNLVVTAGYVKFATAAANPIVLGKATLNRLGRANITTSKLGQGGPFDVQAQFVPTERGFAPSSSEISVDVAQPMVTAFRITAPQFIGAPGTPLTFTVTAVDRAQTPVTQFTGTIDLFSTTDHGAKLATRVYTFTTADQGSHTFGGGITFHKGGAEVLRVDQANNTRIHGKATFGIE
jgi:hypothetical protein